MWTHRWGQVICRFLEAEGYVKSAIRLPRVSPPKTVIRPMSPANVTQLLRHLNPHRFTGLRNQAMVRRLFHSGIRLMELSGIDVADVEWPEGLIRVRGKGRRERYVPFGTKTKVTCPP
ncbi:MAG: hypothetical protein CME19_25810 [Gemmatimonadetes bacterium]|nr:hypothetical protein [Gemmatimonadota bacterium]